MAHIIPVTDFSSNIIKSPFEASKVL